MIIKKTKEELDKMRAAGRIVAQTLQLIEKSIRAGTRTIELDQLADAFIRKSGGVPAFKGYRGFPASICVSVNEGVVHGIPGERRIKKGDLVSIDVGVEYQNYFADAASTYPVGRVSAEATRLLEATQKALESAVDEARVGNHIGDVSHAVQKTAESAGFSVVREFVGHGIGRAMHEDPQIPNYGSPGRGPGIEEGMALAIEPMVNIGAPNVELLPDRWAVITSDRTLSAHFEHTVAVTKEGPWLLTVL